LEGPLSMILTSQGMPNLQYGKMTAEIRCDFDRYSLDTPMGRIVVPYAAQIGLIANANDLELHVFDGEAVFCKRRMHALIRDVALEMASLARRSA